MKILAWDTSSKAGAIVALESEGSKCRLISEWSLNVDSQHSERLLWGIHQMLESARWRLDEVDAFGVGVGPGSFTGLRIGLTTARTLAHTLNKPLAAVSSLAALARPAALWLESVGQGDTLVVAATDACKGELFSLWGHASSVIQCAALPEGDYLGLWQPEVQEQVLRPENLIEQLEISLNAMPATQKRNWLVVGEGRSRYVEAWAQLSTVRERGSKFPFSDQVQGRYLGMLVCEVLDQKRARKALDVYPRYVRASDAEVKLKAGQLKQAPLEVSAAWLKTLEQKS